jgi:hypothetical protein
MSQVSQLTGALDGVLQLSPLRTTAAKLLQLARSAPGVVSTLVGHKTREYVEDNVQVRRIGAGFY